MARKEGSRANTIFLTHQSCQSAGYYIVTVKAVFGALGISLQIAVPMGMHPNKVTQVGVS